MRYAALLLLLMTMGCNRDPQKAHWVDGVGFWGTYDQFVCDDGGKIIAAIDHDSDGTVSVFGGDGAGYGEYRSTTTAKQRAEEITRSWFIMSHLDHCP
jgi:hypothetical protein